jgi:hypothetical protein
MSVKSKFRPTGCAKFGFILLLVAPLAFVGASLYRGENPIENIQRIFKPGMAQNEEETSKEVPETPLAGNNSPAETDETTKQLEEQIKALEERVSALEANQLNNTNKAENK